MGKLTWLQRGFVRDGIHFQCTRATYIVQDRLRVDSHQGHSQAHCEGQDQFRLCLEGIVEYSECPGMWQWSGVQTIEAMAPVTA